MKLFIHTLLCTVLAGQFSGCVGQVSKEKDPTTTLSKDFDTNPPFYYKIPNQPIAVDTSAGWKVNGQKILLTGTVYEANGTTPAKGALLYYYHTNPQGVYEVAPGEPLNMPKNALGQTHGYMRGWIQTGADGTYEIYTVLPGSYPSRKEPAHVHISVKEPHVETPYYLDDFVFDHDPLLTSKERNQLENRGGSGVIRFVHHENLWVGERDIYLGRNIPNYPNAMIPKIRSGKMMGEDITSFTPYHAYGPDAGTTVCPICKYGWYHGILYFVGADAHWPAIKKWLQFLEEESIKRSRSLKVYFVYGNPNDYDKAQHLEMLKALGAELNLEHVALTFVPSFTDTISEIDKNQINPDVENTFLLYKRSKVIGNFVNLDPTPENFQKVKTTLDASVNPWFYLSAPTYKH